MFTYLSSKWLQENDATHPRHVFTNNSSVLGQ